MSKQQKRNLPADEIVRLGEEDTQVNQEAKYMPIKKRLLRSLSSPAEVTTQIDSASQAQSPSGKPEGEISISEGTRESKLRSEKAGRAKSKKKQKAVTKMATASQVQAPDTTRRNLRSSSHPAKVTPDADSASQSQSPPEGSQGEVSTTEATPVSNPESKRRRKRKSKGKKKAFFKNVNTLMNHIIEMYQKKEPITKKDMLKTIGKKDKKRFPKILEKASFNIEIVFGMELIQVGATTHSYVLVDKMNLPNNGMLTRGKGFPKTGLLMHILGLIFVKGNSATEENIWQFLNKMKIYDGQKHFLFGEPRKLITKDLVKFKYLECCQVPNSEPPRYEFVWGPRAYAETTKMKVLEFWAKINKSVPSAFDGKYEEALREEGQQANAIVSLSRSTNDPLRELSISGAGIIPTVIQVEDDEDEEIIVCD